MTLPTPSRRHFLQLAAGAGVVPWAAGGAACSEPPQTGEGADLPRAQGQPMPGGVRLPETPPEPGRAGSLGIAVIGLGGYALRQMMPNFANAERAHIAALVSGNAEKAARVGDAYGVPEDARYSYETFDRIAEDDRVDAVYIVLPNGLHAGWAEKAFAAGKHVLCEKPMALTSAECQRMIDAGRRADRKLMIAYRCHFEPYNLRAMALMDGNAVGDLRMIRTGQHYVMGETTPARNWRARRALAGRSPLEDYGLYGLQSALYLSNEMPQIINARTFRPEGDPRFAEIYASVATMMQFPSGALAQLSTSYDAASSNRAIVRGTGGTLTMDPATNYGGLNMVLDTGTPERLTPGDPSTQFAGQLDHFAGAVRDGIPIRTPGEMGRRDLRLIEAIYASAENGRAIALNPDGTMRE